MGHRSARIDRQGATDKGYAFFKPASHGGGNTGKVERIKIFRIALHYGAKARFGISGAALLEKRDGFGELLFMGTGGGFICNCGYPPWAMLKGSLRN